MVAVKQKVHLVLGSGGARGVAHIGVIEAAEAAGYEICGVTGTSMGAVVGGMYCAGHLQTYKNWLLTLTRTGVLRLFDLTITRHGFVKGEKVFSRLIDFTGHINIEDLPVPFMAIAADINSGQEVCFTSGNLYKAMRASTAIPGVFTPVMTETQILVDGAVLNPLPLNKVSPDPEIMVIAVSLNGQPSPAVIAPGKIRKPGFIDILNTSYDLTQEKLMQLTVEKYKPGILVEIPRNICGLFDFHKAADIIEAGRQAFAQSLQVT